MSRRVSAIPSGDDTFQEAATNALSGIDGQATEEEIAPLLADLLRPTYPAVDVRRQHVLARISGDDVWYVFRDGGPPQIEPPAS
jgi:hypothetical protein